MSLKEAFNEMDAAKVNNSVLRIYNGVVYTFYDFAQRVMMTVATNSINSTPFAQLDRETLIEMRDKLVALKGNPPELPPEEPAAVAAPRKFNL